MSSGIKPREFKVNDYLSLKLEEGKANIYVNGELFRQCKYLFIEYPVDKMTPLGEIESIDEAVEMLDNSLEEPEFSEVNIPPEVEFWGHCSNLQAWYEFGYNTKLLHSNLAFPLLKKLQEAGDPQAKRVFKEEIIERFLNGSQQVEAFLREEGFLNLITDEEKYNLFALEEEVKTLKRLEVIIGDSFGLGSKYYKVGTTFILEKGKVVFLSLFWSDLILLPRIILELIHLRGLRIEKCELEELPDWIGEIRQLEELVIVRSKLKTIPSTIGNLKNLKVLELKQNSLESIPDSIGDLANLEVLLLSDNKIRIIPESIGKLKKLRKLDLDKNKIFNVPESVNDMTSLDHIRLFHNPIFVAQRKIKKPLLLTERPNFHWKRPEKKKSSNGSYTTTNI